MAQYYSGQLQKGSSGDEVKKWQEYLNTKGYGLTVDGIFGDKTDAATKQYQSSVGLGADGIVGVKTWGSAGYKPLNSVTEAPTSTPFEYDDFTYDDYKESDAVINAGNKKTEAENAVSNYGDFSYSNDASFKAIMDKILNREKFSYDLNGDALYQQYKDKYIQQGKMAMQDTMGQAAAMTGGYGNSYASTAGNQAYQASLENLNDIVPELYQLALDKYNMEGQDLYNQYGMLSDDRNMEYGMWADKYNQLIADRGYYADAYDAERSYDYNKYNNERDFAYGTYADDRNLAYNTHRDSIEDARWQAEFDETLRQHEQNMAFQREQWDWQKSQYASSGSSGGSSSGSSGGGSGGSGSGAGSSGSGGSNTPTIPKGVTDAVQGAKTNQQKADILAGYVNDGVITTDQASEILAQYGSATKDLKDRTWTKTGKNSVNWFGGVDNNDRVKDQYGNVYRLDDLVDALVKEGMSKKDAKNFVKKFN